MSQPTPYPIPAGTLGLEGPVERVEPGTLPLRGDLAHIALAGRYLAANFAIPVIRAVGAGGAALHLTADGEAQVVARLEPGERFEALDYAGDWCWGCRGPEGPTGYVRHAALAPEGA